MSSAAMSDARVFVNSWGCDYKSVHQTRPNHQGKLDYVGPVHEENRALSEPVVEGVCWTFKLTL